jgi:hypothetical protein
MYYFALGVGAPDVSIDEPRNNSTTSSSLSTPSSAKNNTANDSSVVMRGFAISIINHYLIQKGKVSATLVLMTTIFDIHYLEKHYLDLIISHSTPPIRRRASRTKR